MEKGEMGENATGRLATYYVAECMEFNRYGEYREDIQSAEEAVKYYQSIPSERLNAGKGIGLHVEEEDGIPLDFPLVSGGKLDVDFLGEVYGFKEYPELLRAARELSAYLPETKVVDTKGILTKKSMDAADFADEMIKLEKNLDPDFYHTFYPKDIEQREGRIIRQGNENEEVNIYRYVTKGSFDAYLWGIVETKQRFISQVFTSRELARICEDIDETVLNFAEIKAVASENPLIMEKIQVDNEVARLRILKAAHEGKRFALQDAVTFQYPKRIQSLKGELQLLQKDLERRNQAMEVQQGFAITLQGKVYEKHKEAGEVLRGIIEGVTAFTRHEVGMYKGFQVSVQNDMLGPILFLQGEKEYSVELKSSDSGNMVRIENRLNALDKAVEEVQKEIKTCENEIKNAKQEYEKPFPYEELLKENITRQMEIDAELEIKDQEECMEVQEETKNLSCQTAVR